MSLFKHHVFRKNNQLNLNDECLLGVIQEIGGYKATDIRAFFARYTRDNTSSIYKNSITKLVNLNFVSIKMMDNNKKNRIISLTDDGATYISIVKSFYE
jgi:hypothetical protein